MAINADARSFSGWCSSKQHFLAAASQNGETIRWEHWGGLPLDKRREFAFRLRAGCSSHSVVKFLGDCRAIPAKKHDFTSPARSIRRRSGWKRLDRDECPQKRSQAAMETNAKISAKLVDATKGQPNPTRRPSTPAPPRPHEQSPNATLKPGF